MNTKTMHSVVRHTSWRSLDAGPWRISNDRDLINWWVTKIRSKCKRKRLFFCRRILNFVVAVIFRTQYVCEMKNKVDRFRIMKPVNLFFYFSLSTICFGQEYFTTVRLVLKKPVLNWLIRVWSLPISDIEVVRFSWFDCWAAHWRLCRDLITMATESGESDQGNSCCTYPRRPRRRGRSDMRGDHWCWTPGLSVWSSALLRADEEGVFVQPQLTLETAPDSSRETLLKVRGHSDFSSSSHEPVYDPRPRLL